MLEAAGVPNTIYDALTGEKGDPSKLDESGVVHGSWTTSSGAEYESASFYELPKTSVELEFATSGGATIVAVDKVEITDGDNTQTLTPFWYSPGLMSWPVGGKEFAWDAVQVKIYVRVLNTSLSPGMLGMYSPNIITWKPSAKRCVRMGPRFLNAP